MSECVHACDRSSVVASALPEQIASGVLTSIVHITLAITCPAPLCFSSFSPARTHARTRACTHARTHARVLSSLDAQMCEHIAQGGPQLLLVDTEPPLLERVMAWFEDGATKVGCSRLLPVCVYISMCLLAV